MWLLLFQTAWRNLWRNKRRSWLTIAAIAFALMLSFLMRGIQIGTYELNIQSFTSVFTGHLQIQHQKYRENPSLRNSFSYHEKLKALLARDENIVAIVPRILAGGLISNRDDAFGILLWGVDPTIEKNVTTLSSKVSSGRWFRHSREVILGETLLKNLGLTVGDSVIILAPGYDGTLGNQYFRIIGSFRTGSQEMDRMGAIAQLSDVQNLLNMHGRITHLLLFLRSFDNLDAAAVDIQSFLPSELRVIKWYEVSPSLKQLIELDNISGILFLTILLVVVGFGILNTLLMAITERFREFGILLAIGLTNGKLALITFIETIFMICIGVVIGSVLGFASVLYFYFYPVTFTGELAQIYVDFGFLPQMTAAPKMSIYLQSLFLLLSISLLATLYPIWKTFRLEPLKGIRYT